MRKVTSHPIPKLDLKKKVAVLTFALILPIVSWRFADIDQMDGSGNAYSDQLAGNGMFTFAAALRRNDLDYDRFYETIPQEEADSILSSLGSERTPLVDLLKQNAKHQPETFDPLPFLRRPKNIVLISVESLSASFMDSYGAHGRLTPRIDQLAKEGLKFEHFFATGTRTVRGLEALSLGIPPVPGQAIVRRLHNEHLATLGEILSHNGFSTFFFYGGYSYFDNMKAYFSANSYRVVDRGDFPKQTISFENAWGVADETLFSNTFPLLDQAHEQIKKPFFAHIMTTSNHRPFTYPQGRIDVASPGGRNGAVKYSDFAVGQFIEEAKHHSWFDDTLFIITADHCASVAGRTKLPIGDFRIPLIFYGPKLIKPGNYNQITSQIDVPPSVLEILGIEGGDHFFGRAFFGKNHSEQRAFVSNYQELGYYKNNVLTVLLPKKKIEAYRVDPKSFSAEPMTPDPKLVHEAIAYYQTAFRAFKAGALESTLKPF